MQIRSWMDWFEWLYIFARHGRQLLDLKFSDVTMTMSRSMRNVVLCSPTAADVGPFIRQKVQGIVLVKLAVKTKRSPILRVYLKNIFLAVHISEYVYRLENIYAKNWTRISVYKLKISVHCNDVVLESFQFLEGLITFINNYILESHLYSVLLRML